MHRTTAREAALRVGHGMARTTINKIDDDKMMQEADHDMFAHDKRERVERVQNYGFTSAILPRDEQQSGHQKDNGNSADGYGKPDKKGPSAEGVVMHHGGQRNHPVLIAVDDRRYRPRGLKPGENAQYDDIGQMNYLKRDAHIMLSHDGEDGQGKKATRYASLRHVVKKKQPKAQSGNSQAALQSQQQAKDFKHEGESINSEVRVTASRIEFRVGDTVVGYYDKSSSTWTFIGTVKLGAEDASHPVYGVNGGVGKTTKTSGAAAVLVKATEPGPPTSQDAQP